MFNELVCSLLNLHQENLGVKTSSLPLPVARATECRPRDRWKGGVSGVVRFTAGCSSTTELLLVGAINVCSSAH
jgi:hypothetical protein